MHNYSVSLVKTATTCTRKWWFDQVIRLPKGRSDAFSFGTVTHSVIERALLGYPLFPEGWTTVEDTKRKQVSMVDALDADLIRALVERAIAEGIIAPLPEMAVEMSFEETLPEGLGTFTGQIDVYHANGIQDHKTTKATKWLLSQQDLADDLQMNAYARQWFMRHPDATHCEVRHNGFVKDPPAVTHREVVISRAACMAVWDNRIMTCIRRMAQWQAFSDRDKWFKVPGPHEDGACTKYGGCVYSRICTRAETVSAYERRVLLSQQPATIQPKMSNRFTRDVAPAPLSAKNEAAVAAAMTDLTTPKRAEPAVAAPVAPAADVTLVTPPSPAPWAQAECENCGGAGYTKKGKTCIACASKFKERTATNASDLYKFRYVDNRLTWEQDGKKFALDMVKTPVVKESPAIKAVEPQIIVPQTEPTKAASKSVEQEPTDGQMVDQIMDKLKDVKLADEKAKPDPARPRAGFTLVIGCTLTAPGGLNVISVEPTFLGLQDKLVKAANPPAQSFYQLDTWKRRDALAAEAVALLKDMPEGAWVVCPVPGPDLKAIIDAIRPHAALVIEGRAS